MKKQNKKAVSKWIWILIVIVIAIIIGAYMWAGRIPTPPALP